MKFSIFCLALLLQSCAVYKYEHKADGSCSLTITSMREVNAGDIKISQACALVGGAESLGANEKLIDLVSNIVKKAP